MKRSRLAKSVGLWIALYGPDGAGKSVVAQHVAHRLAPLFSALQLHHLRVHLRQHHPCQVVANPHGEPPRGLTLSCMKLFYMLAESWVAHLLRVRAWVGCGQLVVFDRYFLDYAIDPRRYRLAAESVGLASFLGRWAPRPDLQFVLDVPADELQRRKPEVSLAESKRQRYEYSERIARLPNAFLVDANRPLAEVVEDVLATILQAPAASQAVAVAPSPTFQDATR